MSTRQTTEERVFIAADQLASEGITPSNRLITKEIGGGNTEKIARALKEWKARRDATSNLLAPVECPEEMKRAFTSSAAKLIYEATEGLQAEIQYYKHQEDENIERFAELDRDLASTKELLEQEQRLRTDEKKNAEHELTTLRERNAALESRIKEFERDLESLQKQVQVAITERTKAELERDTIKEATSRAQQLIDQLQKSYTAIRDEKEASKVHLEHLKTQLGVL